MASDSLQTFVRFVVNNTRPTCGQAIKLAFFMGFCSVPPCPSNSLEYLRLFLTIFRTASHRSMNLLASSGTMPRTTLASQSLALVVGFVTAYFSRTLSHVGRIKVISNY
jgi:hypothetical protein